MVVKAQTIPNADSVVEMPSHRLVRESNPVREVVDELGRTIRYRNLSILDQARLAKALGEHSSNLMYSRMIAFAACVIDIDGEQGPPKHTIAHLEHRLEWLKDEGWQAIVDDDNQRREEEDPIGDRDQQIKN